MKEAELRTHAICSICRKPIGASNTPFFWRVTVEYFCLDMRAVQRQQGLSMMLGGNASLAIAMGSNEDMAKHVLEPATLTVCQTCCTKATCVVDMAAHAGGG